MFIGTPKWYDCSPSKLRMFIGTPKRLAWYDCCESAAVLGRVLGMVRGDFFHETGCIERV